MIPQKGKIGQYQLDRYASGDSVSSRLFKEARWLIPGGTSRQFYTFQPNPIFAKEGDGCWVTDVDGDRRIDCLNNMSALVHGHAFPDVVAAIHDRVAKGFCFSEPCEKELELAKMLVERVPSVEKVHFRSSGTEAVMMAAKLCRAFTGRNKVAKFEGSYHGYYDHVQMSVAPSPKHWGSAHAPSAVPSSAGLSSNIADEVVVLPNNDPESIERILESHGSELAMLLVEPLANRSGMSKPAPGFYRFLREITSQYGILLVFDEIITFRLGIAGAQGRFDGSPDLTTFGKVIGGGLPIGALGGRSDVMDLLDPTTTRDYVVSGGTYSGNPLSIAAGIATLNRLTQTEFDFLDELGTALRSGVNGILKQGGLDVQVTGEGSLFQIIPGTQTVSSYRDVPVGERADELMRQLHTGLLHNGVIVARRGFGCLSTAMDLEIIGEVLSAFDRAVAAVRL